MIYFNGFGIAVGTADFTISLQRHGEVVATLSASYTVAKTFAASLTEAMRQFEHQTAHEIMTVQDINKALSKSK